MASSKYKIVSGDAKCPYYTYETSQYVHCSAIAKGAKIRMVFDKPTVCINYKREHCHHIKGWESCRIAQSLSKIWEEEERNGTKNK